MKDNTLLCMTLLVRNEEDIIEDNIVFHLNHGVDFIVATDNASTDKTRSILTKYQKMGLLYLIDEANLNMNQAKWVTRMAIFARDTVGATWILNNDADEFWYPLNGNLKTELYNTNATTIACQRRHMITSIEKLSEKKWFDMLIYRATNPVRYSGSKPDIEESLHEPYFYRDLLPKVMCKAKGLREVTAGNHNATYKKNINMSSSNIVVYHFPVRLKEKFIQGVRDQGEALESNTSVSQNIGWHRRRWFSLLSQFGSSRVFEDVLPSNKRLHQDLLHRVLIKDETIRTCFQYDFNQAIDEEPTKVYNNKFYKQHDEWHLEYGYIAKFLTKKLSFQSAVDFGCGRGDLIWYLSNSGKDIIGVDGSRKSKESALDDIKRQIEIKDLRLPLFIGRFDLVICTEVAEHIEEIYTETFLDNLARATQKWLYFTAATPEQTGGVDHVNLQPHKYWIKKLDDRGLKLMKNLSTELQKYLTQQINRAHWFLKNSFIFERKENY